MTRQSINLSRQKKGVIKAEAVLQSNRLVPKTHVDYWKTRVFLPIYTRSGVRHTSAHYAIAMKYQSRRLEWSLHTADKTKAAELARSIWLSLVSAGWEATIQRFRPKHDGKPDKLTVGEFIEAVKEVADTKAKTIHGYSVALRRIAADIAEIKSDKTRFDYSEEGGYRQWLDKIDAQKLSVLTPQKIQAWKRSYIARADQSQVAQRKARIAVNSYLRRARSLFSKKITRHLTFPVSNPFIGVDFEPRQSTRYQSSIDLTKLIAAARKELSTDDPECFKILLLGAMAGLRRHEIDLLPWTAFQWDKNVIRIAATRFFHPKSEDSVGDVQVDPEMMEIFRGYHARALGGEFVVESWIKPRPAVTTYEHYRCGAHFERLAQWLRKHGVRAARPLHELRKEFGSVLNEAHGIHVASRSLRHAQLTTTAAVYVDNRRRATIGLGHLLKDDAASLENGDKLVRPFKVA
jgi:hypothetical protein